jgi:fermentation-respiration switch protein FrsA (DUF1100 family)
VLRLALNSLLYFPAAEIQHRPADIGRPYRELWLDTDDGERLHAWWVPASSATVGHILLCHGNAGNIGDRVLHAELLCDAGFDVMLFDYRGYGRSTGRPDEHGTYRDARAVRAALLRKVDVDPARIIYLGESLGGAVALDLAVEHPPRGLVLQSTFIGVREMARLHYPFVPSALVPDVYPSLRRVRELRAPLLVIHGERDAIVPLAQGRALFEAARVPKRMHVFPGLGHNDLVPRAGRSYSETILSWAATLDDPPART